jgi:hypothetical protein
MPRDDHLGHPVAQVITAVRTHRQQAGGDERHEQHNREGSDQNIH